MKDNIGHGNRCVTNVTGVTNITGVTDVTGVTDITGATDEKGAAHKTGPVRGTRKDARSMLSVLSCPVCHEPLDAKKDEASSNIITCISCPRGHSYDIARGGIASSKEGVSSSKGYINLLMSNQSAAKRHGDDRLMLTARAEFLDRGYYQPICDTLADMTLPYVTDSDAIIIDCGCGEGWYARQLLEFYARNDVFPDYIGIDISKTAVRMAAKRVPDMLPVVASAYDLPVRNGGADIILSVFAPVAANEFRRALKRGGALFTATACERHLFGLKKAVYDKPYLNEYDGGELEGFRLEERRRTEYTLSLAGEDITRLFIMTPYYYKTSRKDQEKLAVLDRLDTEVSVEIRRYRSL